MRERIEIVQRVWGWWHILEYFSFRLHFFFIALFLVADRSGYLMPHPFLRLRDTTIISSADFNLDFQKDTHDTEAKIST